MKLSLANPSLWRVEQLLLKQIVADPNQPRSFRKDEEQATLTQSMSEDGQTTPIIVYKIGDQHTIVDGEGRFNAAKQLGWSHILAVILDERPDDRTLIKMQTICNTIRSDLSLKDRLMQCFKMKQLQMSHEEIARVLKIQKGTVSKILTLEQLDDDQLEQLQDAEIGLEAAYSLAKTDKAERQKQIDDACEAKKGRKKLSKPDHSDAKRNYGFQMPDFQVSIRASSELGVEELLSHLAELSKVLRKAKRQNLCIATISKMLQDQRCRQVESANL